MENYLNITQLAGLRNATTETLRHYDRIGLLKPAYVDPDTGYRYYSTEQVEIFDTIMDLRDMGLPLKEIQEVMDHRNVENSYEILSKKADELRQEIAEKQKMLLQIEQKTTYINMVKNEKLFTDRSIDESYQGEATLAKLCGHAKLTKTEKIFLGQLDGLSDELIDFRLGHALTEKELRFMKARIHMIQRLWRLEKQTGMENIN